jgi:quercetin dioxygenase-like cupin family protein
MKLSIEHQADGQFKFDGLRPYFEYRDLGIKSATDGKAVAHIVRAQEGTDKAGEWHYHDVNMQVVFVLKGWVIFEYEGHGQHKLVSGTCVHQAPGIRHRELAHSDDLEMLEIVLPGDFETVSLGHTLPEQRP